MENVDDLSSLKVTFASIAKKRQEDLKPSEDDKNLLIVDGNNIGYRYLQRKNFNSFADDYIRTVESLAKSYKSKDIVVAYDFGKSEYRKAIFPEYKANRTPPTEEEKDHFDKFFAELNSVSEKIPYQTFKLFGVEADDIITYLALKLKSRYPHIWIVSSDRDLYQLLDDNISIFNLFSRKELTKKWLWDEKGLTPEQHQLSKIIQGDKSDNIAGIDGIGEKRGDDLAKTYKNIGNLLNKLPLPGRSKYIKNLNEGKDLLLRNEQLINLTYDIRKIIAFGPSGEKNIKILDDYSNKILTSYPEVITQPILLEKTTEVTSATAEVLERMVK
jgi:5'-3' exonuclease